MRLLYTSRMGTGDIIVMISMLSNGLNHGMENANSSATRILSVEYTRQLGCGLGYHSFNNLVE